MYFYVLPLFDISERKSLISFTNLYELETDLWILVEVCKCGNANCWNSLFKTFHCCVGIYVLTVVNVKNFIFWHVTPCSPLRVNWRFGEKYLQTINPCEEGNRLWSTLVPCLASSLNMMIEGTYSSETSVDLQRTTRRYITEDIIVFVFHPC
jgi:hypothetical protein